jgi:hypothetical protein
MSGYLNAVAPIPVRAPILIRFWNSIRRDISFKGYDDPLGIFLLLRRHGFELWAVRGAAN